jgi:hypothetical protein
MISTKQYQVKTLKMTPEERKKRVADLREQHEDYFNSNQLSNAAYIPKMAYRPPGKDDLHISFFPSELERNKDIYTEFVSIDYESEDPKRTLYLYKYNAHWREEYELVESSSGFQRHLVPVSELKIVSDVVSKQGKNTIFDSLDDIANLPNPDETFSPRGIVEALNRIADSLERIESKLNK